MNSAATAAASDLDSIVVLYRDRNLQLWGIPYDMRRDIGQQPKNLDDARNTKGWIYLGSTHVARGGSSAGKAVGWFGSMSESRMAEVKSFLEAHADEIPMNHFEWCKLMSEKDRTAVDSVARADAKIFTDEFPGQTLKGDWDSEAWAMAPKELRSVDGAWNHYRSALAREIASINAE